MGWFTVDDKIIQDAEGTDCIVIWGPEGSGNGCAMLVYDETRSSHYCGGLRGFAQEVVKRLNDYESWYG